MRFLIQNKCSSCLRSSFLLFSKIADINRKSFLRRIQSGVTWRGFIWGYFSSEEEKQEYNGSRHALNSLNPRSVSPEYNNSSLLYDTAQRNLNSGIGYELKFSSLTFLWFRDSGSFIHSFSSVTIALFISFSLSFMLLFVCLNIGIISTTLNLSQYSQWDPV